MGGGLQEPEGPEVMFEFLWAGMELDAMGQLHIQDEELASTRPGCRLKLLQHLMSSNVEDAEQQLQQFQLQSLLKGPPLSPWEFEQLLLTGLLCIHRLHMAGEAQERGHWAAGPLGPRLCPLGIGNTLGPVQEFLSTGPAIVIGPLGLGP